MITELAWPVVALVGIGVAAKLVSALLSKLEAGKAWAERVERLGRRLLDAENLAHGAQALGDQNSSHMAKLSARMDALEAPRPVAQAVRR